MEILQIIHNLNPGIEIIRFSAVGIAVAAVVIAAGSLAYSLYIMRKAQQNQEELAPNSLDEFAPTQAREGLAIPLIYGKVRLPGNIMWYGNLITEKITEDTGGKGGGGGDVTTGYKYYIDVWQGLSIGKVVINGIFVNGDQHVITIDGGTPGGDWIQEGPKPEKEILVTDLITNDGTQNTFPTQPGEFAQKLPGVAHVFFQKWFIGENVSQIPITHFMLERTLVSPVTPANGLKGANPAAVVHDLLSRSGVPSTDFDFTSFNAAAAYWEDRYELNLSFTAQADTAEMIRKVLGYVGGILALDNEGRCTLKTLDPSVTPSATLSELNFIEFEFVRRAYTEMANDFTGTFKDETQDFSQRTIQVKNSAHIQLTGFLRPQSVDLSPFRVVEMASRRIFEIMKRDSYPLAEIEFSSNLQQDNLLPGDVVRISHVDFGIVSADFRVVSADYTTIDKNLITFKATQLLETLFDDIFLEVGGSEWVPIDFTPDALVKQAVFELPFNSDTLHAPAYLMLAHRVNGFETAFEALFSATGTGYTSQGEFSEWAQHGTLDEAYPSDTFQIDDEQGILYTPTTEDPVFSSISREDLFNFRRVAIIGNEMLSFQLVVPEGPNSFRLLGVIRGVLHTPIESHSASAQIWIANISARNTLTGVTAASFFLKYLPKQGVNVLEAGDAAAIPVTLANKAAIPWRLGRLQATRTGSNIDLVISPDTQDAVGAGGQAENAQTDQAPPWPHAGDFEIVYDAVTVFSTSTNFSFTRAGAFFVTVRHRNLSRFGEALVLSVGASDGSYIV